MFNGFDPQVYRLYLTAFSFIIALILARMAIIEWHRNNRVTYKYLALGFGIMLIKIVAETTVSLYALWSSQTSYSIAVPLINHLLRTAGYIYIAAAFVTVKASFSSRFIRSNFIALFTLTASVCLAWYFEGAAFSFGFWGDLLFQVWNLGLLVFTVLTVSRFNLSIKRGLIIATSLLIIKHGIQVYNLFHPGEPSPFLLAVIPSLVVIYFYLMISTLHRKIISDLLASDQEKNRIREKGHQDALRALINSLEAKDIYTRGHSDRVTEYAMVIGQKLGLPEEDLAKLYYGAILHDIGKIGISEGILNNPLSLCHDDFNCIKKHPEIGATIVSSIDSLKNIGPSILYHHERYDGSGYPMGLRGKEIPLHSRIIAIADALDAMSSKRIYRIPFTEEKAIQELIAGAGTQFDPELVKVLMDAFNIKQSSTGSAVSRSA